MHDARWKIVGLSLVIAGAVAWLLGRDGGDETPPSAGAAAKLDAKPSTEVGVAAGDPLLERAREGIRGGSLPEGVRAEMLGSTAPEHARAQRVLLAMDEPPPGAGERAEGDEGSGSDDARPRPPPILPPSEAEAGVLPVPSAPGGEGSGGGGSEGVKASSSSGSADTPVRTPKRRADLGALTLKTTKRGATLTIAAPSSLVVGVANQPASGLVRLVIESAQAGSAVLHARPRTEGAEVTGVRQGQGTVQITIRLEPGWSFDSVQPFSGGAKVHLVAPP